MGIVIASVALGPWILDLVSLLVVLKDRDHNVLGTGAERGDVIRPFKKTLEECLAGSVRRLSDS